MIKKDMYYLSSMCLLSLLCSCSFLGDPHVTSRISPNETVRIGVLDFSHEGNLGISGKLGSYVADRLTNSLFIKKQYDVVDRTIVKAAMVKSKLSPEILDKDQISALGEELRADYLIVGKIVELTNPLENLEDDENWSLEISFRVLDTRTHAVKGVVRTQEKGRREKKVILGKVIDRMAGTVRIRR